MTIEELETELEKRGIRVVVGETTPGNWASYVETLDVVLISDKLTNAQKRAALMHELIHVERGDRGHQSKGVERQVNIEAARRLIRAAEYARAEEMHPGSVGGVAAELDVPVWLVEAYCEHLRSRSRN